jgi:hypothetical protein
MKSQMSRHGLRRLAEGSYVCKLCYYSRGNDIQLMSFTFVSLKELIQISLFWQHEG